MVISLVTFMIASTLFAIIIMFFFYSDRAHRDLLSFPTRRSSDLSRISSCRGVSSFSMGDNIVTHGERSEEHTSELQSHSDLVCRLLLEKKKSSTRHT